MGLEVIIAFAFLLFLSLRGIHAWRQKEREKWILKENMPEELKSARLVASEKYYRIDFPRKAHGAVDQLHQCQDRTHILSDTKTRDRVVVYLSDIVQLSIYRLILVSKGLKVRDYAYFRLVTPTGVQYLKRQLLTEEEAIHKYDTARALLSGKKTPSPAQHKALCVGCNQQVNCDEWLFNHNKQAKE